MSKEYNLGKAKGKFDKLYMTPLQALERIGNIYTEHDTRVSTECDEDFDLIETALKEQEEDKKLLNEQAKTNRYLMEQIKQSQNKLKALEIIKNKHINCIDIITTKDYEEYIDEFNRFVKGNNPLNREEYELLKEILLWD